MPWWKNKKYDRASLDSAGGYIWWNVYLKSLYLYLSLSLARSLARTHAPHADVNDLIPANSIARLLRATSFKAKEIYTGGYTGGDDDDDHDDDDNEEEVFLVNYLV